MDLSIVIPAFNEAGRISHTLQSVVAHLGSRRIAWEVIVVDDGSHDGTAAAVERLAAAEPRIVLIQHERNQGKGASVKRGMLAARGTHIFFMDADLSVPIEELDPAYDEMVRKNLGVLIGSRRVKGARIEQRQPRLRELMGNVFTWLTRLLLAPHVRDFTCGFKGFRRREARRLFSLQRCSDWAFDAEVLYLARLLHVPVHQRPVRWRHGAGSKVRFPRDIVRTLAGLVRIRLRTPALARQVDMVEDDAVEVPTVHMAGDFPREADPTR